MDALIIISGILLFLATGMAVGFLRASKKRLHNQHRANLQRIKSYKISGESHTGIYLDEVNYYTDEEYEALRRYSD